MYADAELHIDLFNFEDEKYEGSKYILTSPRSLQACSRVGIKPVELLPKQISDFKEEYIPQGLPMRTICAMHREYECKRLSKLQRCIEERQEIIKEEYRPEELSEALDSLHLSSQFDVKSSIDHLDEFQGESDDEALHRDSVTKAGAASALSVGSMTTDVIDQCDNSAVRPVRRCQSDLGYVSQETVNSDVSASSLRPRSVCRKVSASSACTVNHGPIVNRVINHPSQLRAKDQKILLIMAAKRADQTRHNKMAEKAHKRWEVERNQQIRTAEEQELQRWHSLAQQRQKQEQQKLELSAKRERVEEEVKCSRQQKMERTMQMSAIAAINQNLARLQKQDQIQKEEVEKMQHVRSRLQQHSLDEAEYRSNLASRQRHKIKLASDKRTASEHQRVMNMRRKNQLSREKHEQVYDALRRQWINDRVNLVESVESKQQRTEQQSEQRRQRRYLDVQKRQRDLEKRIEKSQLKQQQMEQALAAWCEKLMDYRKAQAVYCEQAAKDAVYQKSKAAHTLRSRNEKQQQENVRKIAEREREWEMKLKEALAAKEQRIRTVQCEREKMIAESRALAGASQLMREKLKAAYSVNDFDELSRRADTENKLLVKQHYVSRYNPGSASTITLG